METDQDIHIIALVKPPERYVILLTVDCRAEALRTIGRWASDPDLSLNWYDAAVMTNKIREFVPRF